MYKAGKWTGFIRNFPIAFRKLPIVQPKPGAAMDEAKSRHIFPESPPKQCVLTNEGATKIFKLDRGYGLPQDGGTWEWVSGWRVDKHVSKDESSRAPERQIDCDEDGWSYAEAVEHFVTSPTELCWDGADISNDVAKRPYRRRRWTRQRALQSYPHASKSTLQFLRLLSENARLSVTVTKLSDQLVGTKNRLTEAEIVIVSTKEEYARETDTLKRDLQVRDETILRMGGERGESGDTTPKSRGGDLRLDQHIGMVRNAAGGFASSLVSSASNAATNAFRKTPVQDRTGSPTVGDENSKHVSSSLNSLPSENASFDWRRLGRNMTPTGKGLLQGLAARKPEGDEKEEEQQTDGEGIEEEESSPEKLNDGMVVDSNDDGSGKKKKKRDFKTTNSIEKIDDPPEPRDLSQTIASATQS